MQRSPITRWRLHNCTYAAADKWVAGSAHSTLDLPGTPPVHRVQVAVDGSQMSERAAQVAARFCDVKRGDKLVVMHISDREKDEGMSTCQTLTKMADRLAVDLLVLGSFGRKGEKLDMLGSVSDFSLRESAASLCIVRSTSSNFDRQAKFLFATDGSRAAALAFVMLVSKIRRAMDIVAVTMVSTTDGVVEAGYLEHYKASKSSPPGHQATCPHQQQEAFMAKYSVPGKCFVRCIDRLQQTVPEGILEAVRESGSDILAMGISGYGRKKLGSVSEEISIRAPCTTLIIKDSYDVMHARYSTMGVSSLAKELLPRNFKHT
ncbi:hypothetical protein QJQ45_011548 [Haematococcus lacustris]|nr:hypothetical protein QJQ45_011548 [Haematococcus lacustris]